MTEINFEAPFGDERKKVSISQPMGAGEQWHVMVDNYYYGSVFNRNGQWVYFERWLTMDDVQAISERIEEMGDQPGDI